MILFLFLFSSNIDNTIFPLFPFVLLFVPSIYILSAERTQLRPFFFIYCHRSNSQTHIAVSLIIKLYREHKVARSRVSSCLQHSGNTQKSMQIPYVCVKTFFFYEIAVLLTICHVRSEECRSQMTPLLRLLQLNVLAFTLRFYLLGIERENAWMNVII